MKIESSPASRRNFLRRLVFVGAAAAAGRAAGAAELAAVAPRSESELELPERGRILSAKSFLNQPAPELRFGMWLTKKPELKERFVFVFFWATWCAPCKAVLPTLNEIHRTQGERVTFVALSEEAPNEVRRLVSPAIEFFSASDTSRKLMRKLEVEGLPHGIVRWEGHPMTFTGEKLQRLVAKYGAA
ncbi:MAG: TlpA family protein disulfide reductase [Verrucomicrobia bacterium]|nr:TlpA family protein disulfide reductase [Verrucomicrobiota bacterium]